jgi:hypothetical protein
MIVATRSDEIPESLLSAFFRMAVYCARIDNTDELELVEKDGAHGRITCLTQAECSPWSACFWTSSSSFISAFISKRLVGGQGDVTVRATSWQ